MKILLALYVSLFSLYTHAETLKTYAGQTLRGQELINEHPTGNICYVIVRQVTDQSQKGHHCHDIEAQFAFNNDVISKEPITLASRVTNYHRSEYPTTKSCAANVDGKTSGQEIYGTDTEKLYTPFFSADGTIGNTKFDYFLSVDPKSKTLTRARVHILKWFSEKNYDCVNLKGLNDPIPATNLYHGHHGNHDPQPTNPSEKPPGCNLWFAQHGICGTIHFLQSPVVNQDSPFQILLTDLNQEPVDHPPVFVDLWMNMGGHGHGSAPVTTTKIQDGIYRADNVYFVMKGLWQIRVTIGHGTHHAEMDTFSTNIR